jgi:hypothetical protein
MSAQTQSGHVLPVDGPGDPVVTVQRLTKHYGHQIAVDDLTFSLDRGLITSFRGGGPVPPRSRPRRRRVPHAHPAGAHAGRLWRRTGVRRGYHGRERRR